MKNLLIIGAGQYGMVAKEIAESMKCFEKIDFVDDVYPSAVGKICDINKLIHEYDSAVVAIGNTELRLNLIKGLCEIGYEVPTLIHEKAYVSPSAKIGIGCFIVVNYPLLRDAADCYFVRCVRFKKRCKTRAENGCCNHYGTD